MSNLQDGIAALKSGKRDEARRCFIIAMKEDPNNENVWGWLYQVTKNDKEKIDCLNNIIAINPKNEKARQALERLLAPPEPAPKMTNIVSPVPKPPPIATSAERIKPPINEVPKKNKWISYSVAVIVSICVLCIVAALAINSTDPNTRAKTYAEKYNGSQSAYYKIFASTDCIFLQDQFDIAYSSNQISEPGTIYFTRSLGFMTAVDERMKEINCYP